MTGKHSTSSTSSHSSKSTGRSSEKSLHYTRASPLIHIQKPPFRSRSSTEPSGSSSTRVLSEITTGFGFIRMSSKHLRQSIELGVKPHNGLILLLCALTQRFDHIPVFRSCWRSRGCRWLLGLWLGLLCRPEDLLGFWHTSRCLSSKLCEALLACK